MDKGDELTVTAEEVSRSGTFCQKLQSMRCSDKYIGYLFTGYTAEVIQAA